MKGLFSTAALPALCFSIFSGWLPPCHAAGSTGAVPGDAEYQPEYTLMVSEEEATINCEARNSTVFNQTIPGPPIYLQEGKTTWIRVYNSIFDKNTTVHWHGLAQRAAPFSDGTPLISQWPIAPGSYFDYEVRPEAGDAGTYFYHSHVGFQAVTAYGPLIVQEAEDDQTPYQYDDDISLVVSDYYRTNDTVIEDGLAANPFVWSGEPDALLLNGRSGCESANNAADESCAPAVITVEPEKTYRLRFIGGTAISFVLLAIEGHANLTIIEADGEYTKPVCTDHMQLASGQRFSALLTTKSRKELEEEGKDAFWIRYENRDRPTDLSGYAVLQYQTASNATTTSLDIPETCPVHLSRDPAEYTQWMEYTLEPLDPTEPFPTADEVTRTIHVTWQQNVVDGFYDGSWQGELQWRANNLTWSEKPLEAIRTEPYLIAAYKTGVTPDYEAALANGGWDPLTRAWPAQVGEVLDIVWLSNSGPSGGFDFHPMHAHGVHYWDLGSGNGTYDADANEQRFADYTPARRDTTQLYRYMAKGEPNQTSGWRAWRIRVTEDNVGAWSMHCHVLAHMVMGMQTVWVFGNATDILREIPHPYIEGYLDYGGSAYGNDSYDPLAFDFFDSH